MTYKDMAADTAKALTLALIERGPLAPTGSTPEEINQSYANSIAESYGTFFDAVLAKLQNG